MKLMYRIVDRLAMAIWDAELVCGITGTPDDPADFFDATVARGAYPGSTREARRVARFALEFFLRPRKPPIALDEAQ